MKFFHEPLVHFLAIGAALFVLYVFMGRQNETQGLCSSDELGGHIPLTTKEAIRRKEL